ncbi:MAG: lamin tail domain-containing protein, partial [Clostridia bacterium]|nr:lamin tail domain-containing protein [Clostridia bacterium]
MKNTFLKKDTDEKSPLWMIIFIAALILVFAVVWGISDSGIGSKVESDTAVVISEVMSKNRTTYSAEDDNYYDWIEIHNVSGKAVSLEGYYLSDDMTKLNKWAFPAMTLGADGYLLILASGENEVDSVNGEYHTNFKISSGGEDLFITDSASGSSQSVSVGASPADVSYGMVVLDDGTTAYRWFDSPTPGRENTGDYADTPFAFASAMQGIVISEYMTKNTYTIYDSEGDYSDWI